MENTKKNKIIEIILGVILGIIMFMSIVSALRLYIRIFGSHEFGVGIRIAFALQILNIVLIIITVIKYNKWKKALVIAVMCISLLVVYSTKIPVRSQIEIEYIDRNPTTIYNIKAVEEKVEVKYNIYNFKI